VTSRSRSRAVAFAFAFAFGFAATVAGCDEARTEQVEGGRVMSFEKRLVPIVTGADTVVVRAEVARSAEQRTMGLMERHKLAADSGMLFVYEQDQPANSGFWMFRTRIPLDIAFADSTGRIGAILTMQPCEATLAAGCPTYAPNVGYRYALEVNAGFYARRKIAAGARLILR
jgi:uncharacterized membrane protein (UPF0127 family)